MVRKTLELSDAELLRPVRDLFRLTLDDAARTGISRSAWARIEADEPRRHSPGVEERLALFRDIIWIVRQWPYAYARSWAVAPGAGRRENPA